MFSLKHKFLLCKSLSVLLAVLLLGTLSYWLMLDALTAAQREHLEFVAQDTAQEIEAYLDRQKELLQRIETTEYYQRKGDLPLAKYLSQFHQSFPMLIYLNQEGEEEFSIVKGKIGALPGNSISSTLFQSALKKPNTVVLSPLQHSPELDQPVVWATFVHQLYFGEEFAGALAGAIPLSGIRGIYEGVRIGQTGYISLLDGKGVLLDHPQKELLFDQAKITGADAVEFNHAIHRQKSGFGRITLGGVDGFVAYAPVPSLDCRILVTLPRAEFMAAPHQLRLYSLLICLGVLGTGVVMSSLLVRRLTGDLDQITRHTELVAAGDLDSKLEIDSRDEIETLSQSFNTMTDRLRRANQDREAQVAILQSIIDPLVVTDSQGLIIQANPAASSFLGYPENKLLGQPLHQLFSPDEGLLQDSGYDRLIQSAGLRDHETLARTCNGTLIPVLFSCAPTAAQKPQEKGIVGIFKDISDRKQAEAARGLALAEAEAARERLDAILKSVGDGLLVVNLEQTIVLMNTAAEKLLDLPLVEALHRPIDDVIGDPCLRAHLLNATSTESAVSPIDLCAGDGEVMIQARSAAVANQRGEKTGVITLLRDVTQERQLERMKNEFISTAAHELRTPLTSVMGYAELLITPESFGEFSAAERQEFLQEIHAKSEVLGRIITDLLDVGRIESGQPIPLQRRLDDLGKTLAKVVRHFERHSPRHHFVLELPGGEATTLCFDSDRVVQMLENLLSNAVKYSPGGGIVRVTMEQQAEAIQVCVTDQGMGMSREQVARIFDKFYRADASNTGVGGLGLGMSIVRSLVLAHGGQIWVESSPGSGTSVYFTLPLAASTEASAFMPCC